MSYDTTILANSPRGYWKLADAATSGSSGAIVDSSGNGRAGTYTGGFTGGGAGILASDSGAADGSMLADGSGSSHITIPANTAWNFSTGDFTHEVWVQTTNWALTVLMGTDQGPNWYVYLDSSGYIGINMLGSVALGATACNDAATHHVVVTRASGVVRIYRDGTLDCTPTTIATAIGDATSPVGIGGFPGGAFAFAGRIEKAAIYGTALTASQVAAHTAAGAAASSIIPIIMATFRHRRSC